MLNTLGYFSPLVFSTYQAPTYFVFINGNTGLKEGSKTLGTQAKQLQTILPQDTGYHSTQVPLQKAARKKAMDNGLCPSPCLRLEWLA